MNRTFNAIALTALVEIANGRPVMIQEPMAHSAGPIQWWSGSRARDKRSRSESQGN